MNTDTGEIRTFDRLSDAEKGSGKWKPLAEQDLQRLAQLETERLARRNNGVTQAQIDARLERAEQKRQRRANTSPAATPSKRSKKSRSGAERTA